ncbi:transposase [Parasphingopyxis lamellibrachiae]|uniref:Uncharacterized protein n=1 Tax=Parasphingopyxis lamellibrachiae TaxID=680125 RepID=A0A3D9FER7_9SPHN|nr:transposase [Parasphingopyxis lamellibrachiae]RED16279.1 hypothetical protein DFR46_1301 [Parasphingopyxis lamellibrachiae]
MPVELSCPDTDAIGLEEFVESVDAGNVDPCDEASLAAFAPQLGRLANNRRFLAEFVIRELENRCGEQARHNRYGIQVVMLHAGKGYFVRANFWPSERDSIVRASGQHAFFYNLPHDHNFSFLTVGYAGPGYWSDYYEYDYEDVAGYPGEAVPLRFIERSRLEQGRVLLYRAHRDIHRQLPPETLSVSINLIGSSSRSGWSDQYRFDLEEKKIAGLLTTMPSAMVMRAALATGGETGRALVADFAGRHPSDHVRFDAIVALVDGAGDAETKQDMLERGAGDPSGQLAGLCRNWLNRSD